MSESDSVASEPKSANASRADDRSFGAWLREMPRWKKVSVGVALTMVVVAGVLTLTSTGDAGGAATGGAAPDGTGLRTALIDGPTSGTGGSAGAATTEEPASKGFFRLGFSFLAGFCIGSFLRATLKIAAIAVGFWLVMTFALSYMGIVDVDWQAMDDLWSRFAGNIENEWGSFQSFMLGSLPATGLGITGLAVGLKRH